MKWNTDYRLYYRDWLDSLFHHDKFEYTKLFDTLDSIDFRYTHPMDENRESDGINMRYLFAKQCYPNVDDDYICECLERPCSVYEAIVGMCYRLNKLLWIEKSEFALSCYFWDIIDSLGLTCYSDDSYDEGAVIDNVRCALDHDYDPETGAGGFFTVNQSYSHMHRDLCTVELWTLMNLYAFEH